MGRANAAGKKNQIYERMHNTGRPYLLDTDDVSEGPAFIMS